MKDHYEKEYSDLKKKAYDLEHSNSSLLIEVEQLKISNGDLKNKLDAKTREHDKAKDEMKKKDKAAEDRFN